MAEVPGDLGHVLSLPGHVDGLERVGCGDYPGSAVSAGGDVDRDGFQRGLRDGLGAVQDGLDCGGPDQPEQAADHAAAAEVQVRRQPGEGAVAVMVEPQAVLERGDEGLPLLPAAERAGAGRGEPAGDLLAAGADSSPARSTLIPA